VGNTCGLRYNESVYHLRLTGFSVIVFFDWHEAHSAVDRFIWSFRRLGCIDPSGGLIFCVLKRERDRRRITTSRTRSGLKLTCQVLRVSGTRER
jgi:hypothetical protein